MSPPAPHSNHGNHLFGVAKLQPEKYQGKDWNPTASFNVCDFGARQYDPFIARWLSPDPLAEKYYGHSPYLFCAGNPVNFVDPRGETIVVRHINEDNTFIEYEWQERNDVWGFYDAEGNLFDHDDNYIQSVSSALSYLMQGHNGSGLIKTLVDMEGRLLITAHKSNDNFYHQASKSVSWIPNISKLGEPSITLGHELAHALDHFSGTINNDIWIPMETYGLNKAVLLNEIYSTHIENLIRKEHGIPLRNAYLSDETGGRFIGPPIIDTRGRSLYFDASGHTSYSIVKPRNRYKY